jgi:branched-chain amino acid aminotransferase
MTPVPFDDRDGLIWLDGSLIAWRDAKLHVLSHGLHYASAVFEGERAFGSHIFRLEEHTCRLIGSARILGFEIPFTPPQIDTACEAVLAANGLSDAYVRPIAWRGAEQLGVSPRGTRAHLSIAAWPGPRYFSGDAKQGIRLTQARWRRRAPTAAKGSGLYMIGSMAKEQAEQAGYADALMLD